MTDNINEKSVIMQMDDKYVAGTYKRFPVEIVSGQGSIVYDEKGKEYIDMGSGIGVTCFGIADEKWKEAVTSQLGTLQHMSNLYYTSPCAKLAKMLCDKTGMKKVFFGNSGAEANECAIKAARKYAAKTKGEDCYTIVTLKNSFHGRTLTTLAATGQEHYHELFRPLTPGFAHIDPANGLNDLKSLSEKTPIAAVMIECIQGEGGVNEIGKDFATDLWKYCRDNDALLIVDEVQTGNGRSGKLYSYMNYGISPDIVTTAKGLGGGLPIGAVMLSEKVCDIFEYGDHGSTFGGNPAVCAGALSILSRIDDDFLASVRKKSDMVFTELNNAPGIEKVTGMGLMIGIKTEKPAGEVMQKCMENGVLCLTAKDKLRLLPALNIPEETLMKAVRIIKEAASPAVADK